VLTNQGTLNKIFDYNSLMEYCISFTLNILSTNDIKNNIKKNIRNYEPENEVKLWREGTNNKIWYNFLTGAISTIAGFLYDLYNYSHELVLNSRDITSEIGMNVYNIVASNWISEAINVITAKKIDEKLGIKNPSKERKYESVVPGYSLDDSSGEDKLSIMKDVDALATLIAYNKLNPPLAIGIFGKWGAGKSFFMDKLRFKVEELSKMNESFCNDVVHVRFNAWYYSDTNLWASLVEKIFNELSNYAKKRGKEKEAGEILFEKLESSKNAILEIQNKINSVNESKKILIIEKSKAEKDKSEKINNLKDVKIKDINEIIKTDENIKNDIDSIKKLIDGLLIENIIDINLNIRKINTSIKKTCYAFNIIRKKRGFEFIIFIGILLGIPLITFILCKVLVEDINRIVKNLIEISSIALGFISSWKLKLEPIVKNLNIGYARLVNLEESWKSVKEKKMKELTDKELNLESDIMKLEKHESELICKMNALEKEKKQLNTQINEIKSGKKLVQFLDKVNENDKYRSQLGIISTVRNDFEQLTELIMRKDFIAEQDPPEEDIFKIDRIVLYIDDLDRCDNKKVIEVLEAVHLILAFNLFVVVVGVDPRWISSALSAEYHNLENPFVESQKIRNNASTFDYLEKIFQIPFTLKEIGDNSSEQLVEYLLREQIEVENEMVQDLHVETEIEEKKFFPEAHDDSINYYEVIDYQNENKKETEVKELKISVDELNFMKRLSPVIGITPRTIKKYVNIYRIIRIHEDMPFYENNKMDDFKAVMFLLVLVTNESNDSFNLFDSIIKYDEENGLPDLKLKDCINSINISKDSNKVLKYIYDLINDTVEVGEIKIQKLKHYASLVQKFSVKANW
jgi:hypothetical protein